MVYNVPIFYVVVFVSVIMVASIIGYFLIRRHLKRENEKGRIRKQINKIGKGDTSV
jgi:preprotein translocase subunit YajC